jgi:hypothetical protein
LIATSSPGSVAAMGSPYGCFCDASRKISPTAAAPSESRSTTRQRREFGHRDLRNKFRFWEFGYVCNAKVNPASKTAGQLLCEPVESFFDQISHCLLSRSSGANSIVQRAAHRDLVPYELSVCNL